MLRQVALSLALLGAAMGWQDTAAQTSLRDQVVIRAELKGPSKATTIVADVTGKTTKDPSTKECNRTSVCETPLYVFPGGYKEVKDPKTWEPDGCSVYLPYSQIKVRQGAQPTLRWVIVKAPDDKGVYSFDTTFAGGILLQPNPKDPSDENDSRYDLHRPIRESDGMAFVWHSLNANPTKRLKSIYYLPVVQRVFQGKTKVCNAADPEVVNEN